MSCMESGEDIHLERTTGCQPSVTCLDATTTASSWPKKCLPHRVSPRSTPSHTNAGTQITLFTSTIINMLEDTVFRVTVVRYNLVLPFVWMTFVKDLVLQGGTPTDSMKQQLFQVFIVCQIKT